MNIATDKRRRDAEFVTGCEFAEVGELREAVGR